MVALHRLWNDVVTACYYKMPCYFWTSVTWFRAAQVY